MSVTVPLITCHSTLAHLYLPALDLSPLCLTCELPWHANILSPSLPSLSCSVLQRSISLFTSLPVCVPFSLLPPDYPPIPHTFLPPYCLHPSLSLTPVLLTAHPTSSPCAPVSAAHNSPPRWLPCRVLHWWRRRSRQRETGKDSLSPSTVQSSFFS